MRIIGYLKQSKVAVALIVVLLIVQAFADLSLPRYTSDLVDVGIQQGGIEDCSPSVMSSDTFNYACMLAPDDDERLLRSSYEQDSDGNFALTRGISICLSYMPHIGRGPLARPRLKRRWPRPRRRSDPLTNPLSSNRQ